MEKRVARRIGGGCCCLVFLTILSLLIAYGVRLGTGDEAHTSATLNTCREGTSSASTLKIITYNLFLIYCIPTALCQETSAREARVKEIATWFQDSDWDVVLLQEIWSLHDLVRDGMTNAGYCHYVMTERKNGSGLAIFSKYPIVEHDFIDWYDAFGAGEGAAPNPFNLEAYVSDKGVMYAKVDKDGNNIHVFNMHTNSDTSGDNHDIRVMQYNKVRTFVDSKEIPSNELVLLGGDFNEDYNCRMEGCGEPKCEDKAYYNEMIEIMAAGEVDLLSNQTFTYDTESNSLLKDLYVGADCEYYRYLLDYIFYSENHLTAVNTSYCEILKPVDFYSGIELSDHYPVSCTYDGIGMGLDKDAEVHDKESEEEEVQVTEETAPNSTNV